MYSIYYAAIEAEPYEIIGSLNVGIKSLSSALTWEVRPKNLIFIKMRISRDLFIESAGVC